MKERVPSELKFFRVLSRAGCPALLPRFRAASVVNGFGCGMLTLLPRLKRSIVGKPWAAECEPGHTSRSRDAPDRAANPAARTRGNLGSRPAKVESVGDADYMGHPRNLGCVTRYRRFESGSLQRRVCKLSVPACSGRHPDRGSAPCHGIVGDPEFDVGSACRASVLR
jgi:hypothetical protein